MGEFWHELIFFATGVATERLRAYRLRKKLERQAAEDAAAARELERVSDGANANWRKESEAARGEWERELHKR